MTFDYFKDRIAAFHHLIDILIKFIVAISFLPSLLRPSPLTISIACLAGSALILFLIFRRHRLVTKVLGGVTICLVAVVVAFLNYWNHNAVNADVPRQERTTSPHSIGTPGSPDSELTVNLPSELMSVVMSDQPKKIGEITGAIDPRKLEVEFRSTPSGVVPRSCLVNKLAGSTQEVWINPDGCSPGYAELEITVRDRTREVTRRAHIRIEEPKLTLSVSGGNGEVRLGEKAKIAIRATGTMPKPNRLTFDWKFTSGRIMDAQFSHDASGNGGEFTIVPKAWGTDDLVIEVKEGELRVDRQRIHIEVPKPKLSIEVQNSPESPYGQSLEPVRFTYRDEHPNAPAFEVMPTIPRDSILIENVTYNREKNEIHFVRKNLSPGTRFQASKRNHKHASVCFELSEVGWIEIKTVDGREAKTSFQVIVTLNLEAGSRATVDRVDEVRDLYRHADRNQPVPGVTGPKNGELLQVLNVNQQTGRANIRWMRGEKELVGWVDLDLLVPVVPG